MLPVRTFVVHASLSLQLVGHDAFGSQVSFASIAPLPHEARQSLSLFALQPVGQQPSPFVQAVMSDVAHCALQFADEPVSRSFVHALLSLHAVGHELAGSQVSFGSMLLSPHEAEQSLSLALFPPAGKQP